MKLILTYIWEFIKVLLKKSTPAPPTKTSEDIIEKPFIIDNVINELPWHESRKWSKRSLASIKKIIVHQELGDATVEQVNNYHIKPNHISPNGCPHICYHYGISKEGDVYHCNHLSHTVWQAKGQNTSSIGIMLVGNFDGEGHKGTSKGPSQAQLISLKKLIEHLLNMDKLSITKADIYGHADFGKPACPGYVAYDYINKIKNEG